MVEIIMSNPVGKPPWIPSQEDIKKAEEYATLGLTKLQIANCLGISYQTLNEKTKEYEDFADAVKRGQDKGIAMVAAKLVNNVNLGNVSAQIFYLKARAKWSDNDSADVQRLSNMIEKILEVKGNDQKTEEIHTEDAHEERCIA